MRTRFPGHAKFVRDTRMVTPLHDRGLSVKKISNETGLPLARVIKVVKAIESRRMSARRNALPPLPVGVQEFVRSLYAMKETIEPGIVTRPSIGFIVQAAQRKFVGTTISDSMVRDIVTRSGKYAEETA
jgi:hypothetical protein